MQAIPLATQMTNEVAIIALESLKTGEADMRGVSHGKICQNLQYNISDIILKQLLCIYYNKMKQGINKFD